jgi:uncharacterized protein (DUF885 family)
MIVIADDLSYLFVFSGLDLFHSQLHDYSLVFQRYEKRKLHREYEYLRSFETKSMTTTERQSYDVMKYFIEQNLQRDFHDQFEYHQYLLNQFMGAQSEIISFLTKFHRISNENDAEAYLLRV